MRLASVDVVTAVAVVGAIDAMHGQDSVLPWLDLSQNVPGATNDLTDLDFADLLAIAIDPAPPAAEFPNIDLGEFDIEQLLAMRTDGGERPLSSLAGVTMEELLRVEVDPEGTEDAPAPFDLTNLGLDILQDLRVGDDAPLPETRNLRLAALDLTSILDQEIEGAGILFDRVASPAAISTSDYVAAQPAPIETITDSTLATAPDPGVKASPPEPVPLPLPVPLPPSPSNRAPSPMNDWLEVEQGDALVGNVMGNDSDPDGDLLTVTTVGLLDTAELGVVEIAADGKFTYEPPGGFHGTDSFMYSVMDEQGATASAMVSIDVIRANSAPVAKDDLFTGTTGTVMSGNVLINDHDPDGDTLTVSSTGLLATKLGGTVRMQADGTFEYKPLHAFAWTDTVTYSVEDGHGGTAEATLTLVVENPGTILNGTAADDRLVGITGDDTLDGKGGNDVLIGLDGADILEGGAGIDTASYEDSNAGVEVSLAEGKGDGGHAEGDTLNGVENLIGSMADDLLYGDSGNNAIDGGTGDDVLEGDAGADLLMGGAGDDILDGGLGIDALLGGAGDDIFIIGPGTGIDLDVIADFKPGADVIDLSEFGLSGMSDLSIDADGIGGTMIAFSGGDSLSLLLVDPASLSPNDFVL